MSVCIVTDHFDGKGIIIFYRALGILHNHTAVPLRCPLGSLESNAKNMRSKATYVLRSNKVVSTPNL